MSQNELQRVVAEMRSNVARGSLVILSTWVATWAERIEAEASRIEAAQAVAPGGEMCAKGQAFKDYVHQRIDAMGVPHSVPESEHDKAGCRIGGRLDFVEARIAPGGVMVPTEPDNSTLEAMWQAWRKQDSIASEKSLRAIYAAMLAAAPASETKDCTCYKYEGRDCRRCFNPPYPDDATSSAAGESDPVQRAVDDAIAKGQDPYLAGITAMAEQEQAGELPELPEPVSSVALAAWGPKPDYYTADQMHAFYRKGYDAALLLRAARVEVTDAMVERAASRFMQVRGLGMHRAWESMTEETRGDYRTAFRAALTAALEPKE